MIEAGVDFSGSIILFLSSQVFSSLSFSLSLPFHLGTQKRIYDCKASTSLRCWLNSAMWHVCFRARGQPFIFSLIFIIGLYSGGLGGLPAWANLFGALWAQVTWQGQNCRETGVTVIYAVKNGRAGVDKYWTGRKLPEKEWLRAS